jgi:hypothetical protein
MQKDTRRVQKVERQRGNKTGKGTREIRDEEKK